MTPPVGWGSFTLPMEEFSGTAELCADSYVDVTEPESTTTPTVSPVLRASTAAMISSTPAEDWPTLASH